MRRMANEPRCRQVAATLMLTLAFMVGEASAATRTAVLKAPAPHQTVLLIGEQEAIKSGANIIRGAIYGESLMDATQTIKTAELRMAGTNDCGPVTTPVWALHVHAGSGSQPLDGWIFVDASTGALKCSRLPFVD